MPRKKTEVLFIKCEPRLKERVREAAEMTGQTMASLMRSAVIDRLTQLCAYYPELREKNTAAQV